MAKRQQIQPTQSKTVILPRFLTSSDIIQTLGCSRDVVYALLASGDIPSIRIGRTYRVDTADFVAWVERNKHNKTSVA